jgi:transcriptional regulator with XRE-family HTH domain
MEAAMQITPQLTDDAILRELGGRIERTRLARNLTRQQLADEAGVGRNSVARMEAGEPLRFITVVRVLRALGFIEPLDQLIPEPEISPIDLLRRAGKTRRRASGRRPGAAPVRPVVSEPFRWGDEVP